MALQIVNPTSNSLRANLSANQRINMRTQVAQSKGTEWMVNSYIAWQQRSPLANEPKRSSAAMLRLVSGMASREHTVKNAIGISFRVIVLALAMIMLGLG